VDQPDEWEEDDRGRRGVAREDVRASFCRKLAQQTLKRYGVTEPPVSVERIATRLGFQLRAKRLPVGVDALLRVEPESRVIEVALGQAQTRQRFSIAHELGHHLLGHRHGESEIAELQANIFAGALLAPGPWLARDLPVYPTADSLARRYAVSREVIFIAAKDARLLQRLK
jgi:hypothetical protein